MHRFQLQSLINRGTCRVKEKACDLYRCSTVYPSSFIDGHQSCICPSSHVDHTKVPDSFLKQTLHSTLHRCLIFKAIKAEDVHSHSTAVACGTTQRCTWLLTIIVGVISPKIVLDFFEGAFNGKAIVPFLTCTNDAALKMDTVMFFIFVFHDHYHQTGIKRSSGKGNDNNKLDKHGIWVLRYPCMQCPLHVFIALLPTHCRMACCTGWRFAYTGQGAFLEEKGLEVFER